MKSGKNKGKWFDNILFFKKYLITLTFYLYVLIYKINITIRTARVFMFAHSAAKASNENIQLSATFAESLTSLGYFVYLPSPRFNLSYLRVLKYTHALWNKPL